MKRHRWIVLCADKTGTLTQNALTVTTVRPLPGFDEAHVLALAALASSDGGQDPVDGAMRAAAAASPSPMPRSWSSFLPFDPAKKMSEATATDATGSPQRIVKGAFAVVSGLAPSHPRRGAAAKELEGQGLPGAGGRRRAGGRYEAGRPHRAQRPAARGLRRR